MRVLLDEHLPRDLVPVLAGHEVVTVQGLGWAGLKNGDLLRQAAGHIDAFITMDSNLQLQQRLEGLAFGVVVIHVRSNRVAELLPVMDLVLAVLTDLAPGTLRTSVPNSRLLPTAAAEAESKVLKQVAHVVTRARHVRACRGVVARLPRCL